MTRGRRLRVARGPAFTAGEMPLDAAPPTARADAQVTDAWPQVIRWTRVEAAPRHDRMASARREVPGGSSSHTEPGARRGVRGNVSTARVNDALLGGKDHYADDRAVAEMVSDAAPEFPRMIRDNRAFLGRAVRHLAQAGIGQFLDLGCGLPTSDNVHQAAQRVNPGCRVAYIDSNPTVAVHAQALLVTTANIDTVTAVQADLRDPDAVLTHGEVRRLLDFQCPVGVLATDVLHYLDDSDDPHGILQQILAALPSGSALVISHLTADTRRREAARSVAETYRAAGVPMTLRDTEQIRGFFAGLDLLDPGVVPVQRWRPPIRTASHGEAWMFGGVATLSVAGRPGSPENL
jgi:O-methyltransferase involved in polyketide biosynthesis